MANRQSPIYIHPGWSRITEFNGQDLDKVYLWGMDLSGSMQGAGGVGGLLSVAGIADGQVVNRHYPTYDGNGNVSEYDNLAGVKVAHFEYDPFGNLTVDSESNAASFPYRFSTKPQDPTTGLLYYGYRFYDPLTGRWPSRDPIQEKGGLNLYAFVGNNVVNKLDLLGNVILPIPFFLEEFCCCREDVKNYLNGAMKIRQMYKDCGSEKNPDGTNKNKTEKDINDCVNRKYKDEWGVDKQIGGETDSKTTKINRTAGRCGIIQDLATVVHEGVHDAQFAGPGKHSPWAAEETVAFEMEAHAAQINFLELVLLGIKIFCK